MDRLRPSTHGGGIGEDHPHHHEDDDHQYYHQSDDDRFEHVFVISKTCTSILFDFLPVLNSLKFSVIVICNVIVM